MQKRIRHKHQTPMCFDGCLAPTATITTPNTTLNQGETLNLGVNYSDAGIKDTHTITWNFDDGSNPVTLTPLGFEAQSNLQSLFTIH
jgi:hypothetical protein